VALLDIVVRGSKFKDASTAEPLSAWLLLDSVRASVASLDHPPIQRVLLSAIDTAQGDLNRAQANIEAWYNSAMDRVAGWYKRRTQFVVFWLGLGVTILMNVDTSGSIF
jgi:hypothetical protein